MSEKSNKNIIDIQGRLSSNTFLDELEALFARPGANFGDATHILNRARRHMGDELIVDALCKRLVRQEAGDPTSILWALETMGGETTVKHLQNLLADPHLSQKNRSEVCYVLSELGVAIDPADLPALPPAEALKGLLDEADQTLNQIPLSERAFALIELLSQIEQGIPVQNGGSFYGALLLGLENETHTIAVDMIWVVSFLSHDEEVRARAKQLLQTKTPTAEMVDGILGVKFSKALLSTDHKNNPNQGQLLVMWEQPGGGLILYTFLMDFKFWGGGVKNFFVAPHQSPEEIEAFFEMSSPPGIVTEELGFEETQAYVRQALQANCENHRPIPAEYYQYHNILTQVLFDGKPPVDLPDRTEARRSPLKGKAGQVENLLIQNMAETAYTAAQITNAQMLWRDYYQTFEPAIRKPEVWSGVIEYIISILEGRADQTQQTIAERYSISAATISNRYREVWQGFLTVENDYIAYQTDTAREPMDDPFDLIDSMFDEEMMSDFFDEEDLPSYEQYLTIYAQHGEGRRKLSEGEFRDLFIELDDLYDLDEVVELNAVQQRRMQELEFLLFME